MRNPVLVCAARAPSKGLQDRTRPSAWLLGCACCWRADDLARSRHHVRQHALPEAFEAARQRFDLFAKTWRDRVFGERSKDQPSSNLVVIAKTLVHRPKVPASVLVKLVYRVGKLGAKKFASLHLRNDSSRACNSCPSSHSYT